MPKAAIELGPLQVSRLTKPGFYFVGGVAGLLLQVLPGGGRTWILRARVGGRRRNMGLGGYPSVTLAGAREAARAARALIDQGIDPIASRKALRAALRDATLPVIVAPVMTFERAAAAYIAAHEAGWSAKNYDAWAGTIKNHANPVIGQLDIAAIDTSDVLAVLEPIWNKITVTAVQLRGRIEDILGWAKVKGYRTGDNPARWDDHLDNLLVSLNKLHTVTHRKALAVDDIPAFIAELREFDKGHDFGTMQALAIEFLILTASRPDETRGAVFAEFDYAKKIWTVPANRMKMGRPHRVPLSDRALEIVKLQPVFVGSDLVFTGARGGKYAPRASARVLEFMGVDAQPHGFRSTFRDWVSERTDYPNEVAEMALAHAIKTKSEAAYRRGDLLEKRIAMMNDWADYCNGG